MSYLPVSQEQLERLGFVEEDGIMTLELDGTLLDFSLESNRLYLYDAGSRSLIKELTAITSTHLLKSFINIMQ